MPNATYGGGYKQVGTADYYWVGNTNPYGNGTGIGPKVPTGQIFIGQVIVFNNSGGNTNPSFYTSTGSGISGPTLATGNGGVYQVTFSAGQYVGITNNANIFAQMTGIFVTA